MDNWRLTDAECQAIWRNQWISTEQGYTRSIANAAGRKALEWAAKYVAAEFADTNGATVAAAIRAGAAK